MGARICVSSQLPGGAASSPDTALLGSEALVVYSLVAPHSPTPVSAALGRDFVGFVL